MSLIDDVVALLKKRAESRPAVEPEPVTSDRYLLCPDTGCDVRKWVSPEDEVASFSELWNHVFSKHTNYNDGLTGKLMSQVVEVAEDFQ